MNETKLRRLAAVLILPLFVGGSSVFAYYKIKDLYHSSEGIGQWEFFKEYQAACPELKSQECRNKFRKFEMMGAANYRANEARVTASTGLIWATVPTSIILILILGAGYVSNGRLPNLLHPNEKTKQSVAMD